MVSLSEIIKKENEFVWTFQTKEMKVPAYLFADNQILKTLKEEEKTNWSSLRQLSNIAQLPLEERAVGLPDIHPGYGSPIGGVIASDFNEGVITFGAVGFDINCGVRTLKTPLFAEDLQNKDKIAESLFANIPAGLGRGGKLRVNTAEMDEIIEKGAEYIVSLGYGLSDDLKHTEEKGRIKGADASLVSERAKKRQKNQIGTLGSGNHYCEVQKVSEIYDEKTAKEYGLALNQVVITFHCGSRALGHQIGMDYLPILYSASKKYSLPLPEKELAAAPLQSPEGQNYLKAVFGGINTAFANRQMLTHLIRETFAKATKISPEEIRTLYDVGHNTAKIEKHFGKKLLVQRKGSTRGFYSEDLIYPEQPIIVGGSMGSSSYILKGTEKAMNETFGSTIHGAGRKMSRIKAVQKNKNINLVSELKKQGIIVKAHSLKGLLEESPSAYKDIDRIVEIMHLSGISTKVAKLTPLINIKG